MVRGTSANQTSRQQLVAAKNYAAGKILNRCFGDCGVVVLRTTKVKRRGCFSRFVSVFFSVFF